MSLLCKACSSLALMPWNKAKLPIYSHWGRFWRAMPSFGAKHYSPCG